MISKSYVYCFVCKRFGLKIIVVLFILCFDVYICKGIFVLVGVRCCFVYLDGEQFMDDVLDKIKLVSNEVNLSKINIKFLLENGRFFVIERINYRFDFDYFYVLIVEDYLIFIGILKIEFDIFDDLC